MRAQMLGPPALGLSIAPAATTVDGWQVRALGVPTGLDGPDGILQGGVATTVLLGVARTADHFDAPVTSVQAQLHAPTPLGRAIDACVRPTGQAAVFDVELRDAGRVLVSGTVELAGHDPVTHVHDLASAGTGSLPTPQAQSTWSRCWVCGAHAAAPWAQRILPGWLRSDTVVSAWMADDTVAQDGVVDPLVVGAVLDCSATWACRDTLAPTGRIGPMLVDFSVRFVRDVPAYEPLRIVGRFDRADGHAYRTRAALVDEDGVVYAVAAGVHVGVRRLPAPNRAE